MSVQLDAICNFEKGNIGLAKATPGIYPLVTTGSERRTCDSYQFDTKAVCIPLVSSTGHGHASLNNVHYQDGKFALGSILVALTAKDESQLDVQYLHLYLSEFKDQILVPLMSGAANVALSVAKIKNIEILLPNINRQREIVQKFNVIKHEDRLLKLELNNQQALLKKLHQQILQEAIEGRLTAKWRAQNPNVDSASKLLTDIAAEKNQIPQDRKLKSQKWLSSITEDEKPYKLPNGWVWCRLGDIVLMNYGKALIKSHTTPSGKYPVYGSNGVVGYYDRGLTERRAVIIGRKGSAGAIQIAEIGSWTTDVAYFIEESNVLNFQYLIYLLSAIRLDRLSKGIKPGLNRDEAYAIIIPFAPEDEQKAIIDKVYRLSLMCEQLNEQVSGNQTNAGQLLQRVLKEAFSQSDGVFAELDSEATYA